jgi:hypothetical protein
MVPCLKSNSVVTVRGFRRRNNGGKFTSEIRMIRKLTIVLLFAFVGMQLIRPQKNHASTASEPDDLFARFPATGEVKHVVMTACYDCHSNNTRYPWYAEIQPGGWVLAKHVRDGKKLLNFSEFGELPAKRAKRQLEACAAQIEDGEMPLKSYTWIHHDARLTDSQKEAVVAWIEATAEKIATRDAAAVSRADGARSVGAD